MIAYNDKLSVVLPVYNCDRYLDQAIQSIVDQTYANFELIIINDGSTDGSLEIIQRHMRADPRIRLIDQENQGLIAALNNGILASRAEYIARMDGDDIAHPERFAKQMAFLEAHPEVALLGTGFELIDENSAVFNSVIMDETDAQLKQAIKVSNCFHHPTVVFKRQAVLDIGLYRQEFLHCEDYDLYARFCKGYVVGNLPEILLSYRIHSHQICSIGNMETLTRSFVKSRSIHFPRAMTAADAERDYQRELFKRYLWWGTQAMRTNGLKDGRTFFEEARRYCDTPGRLYEFLKTYWAEMARFSFKRRELTVALRYAFAVLMLSPSLFLQESAKLIGRRSQIYA
jgi:glycosyltransferase involved in cell wall biosynthesis